MYKSRPLQDRTRESSVLYPQSDASAQKPRPETSMGPPPLQPSSRHANTNLYRPLTTPLPASAKKDLDESSKRQKVSHTEPRLGPREVSVASILKRGRGFDSGTERDSARKEMAFVPRYKRRKVELSNPLYEEYKGCIEASHDTIEREGRDALNAAFEDLSAALKELALEKEGQLETIKAQLASVLEPVTEIKTADGTAINVADEIQSFQRLLETEERFLEEKWADWEKLQEDIAVLGVEVLGEEAADLVPKNVYKKVKNGYKVESEKWMKELEEALKGPLEEIKAAGEEALQKLAAAEKESDLIFNQKKKELIDAIKEYD